MRTHLAVAVAAMTAASAAASAGQPGGDPGAPYRPTPAVLVDPPAYYSPLLYAKKGEPRPGDWMAAHPEAPQSFDEYVRSKPVRPTRGRHAIEVAAVGPMSAKQRARLATLREFLELYYALPVRLGPGLDLGGVTSRERPMFGQTVRQYLTGDILYQVLRPALRDDTFCLLGVTMQDLYPEPSWNYVFGQASLGHRVGVYSLMRFYPEFWGEAATAEAEHLGMVRSLRTLVHETGHMFGVAHCQTYECVMNGSNSLAESDGRPIHLCPECLKKFRWNLGFDPAARYEGLRKFYEAHGMGAEASWVARRLAQCRGGKVDAAAPPPSPPPAEPPPVTGTAPAPPG